MSVEFWQEACYFWEISHESALRDISSLRAERDEAREIARELAALVKARFADGGWLPMEACCCKSCVAARRIRPGVRKWLEE